MAFKISGFGGSERERMETAPVSHARQDPAVPRKSVVQVRILGAIVAALADSFDRSDADDETALAGWDVTLGPQE